MSERSDFYVYEYLREHDSETAKAGTPYYVGKGHGKRAYINNGGRIPPKNNDCIVFVYKNLTEYGAFEKEKELIALYGRKDKKTGILINLTDGGEGSTGAIASDEARKKMSEAALGRVASEETRKKMSEANRNISPEARKKMSEASRNMPPESRKTITENNKKQVLINGVTYMSVAEAYVALGMGKTTYYRHIKSGKIKVEYL